MRAKFPFFILVIIAVTVVAPNSKAQSRQQEKTDSVLALVSQHLKAKDADAIYALTGTLFKQKLSLQNFRTVASQQLFPLGEIKEVTPISFVNNKTATYKVRFEVLTMEVLLSLDEAGKIDLFFFRPFKLEPVNKPDPVATSNRLRSAQDRKVDTAARSYIQKSNTVGVSIGVIKNGQVSLYNYGEMVKGGGHLPTGETLYEIGSITKTFTSALLAYYVNEGKIKLTDPIIKYLPDSVAANPQLKGITLVNLSNHTSGLPTLPDNLAAQIPFDQLNPYKNYNKQLLFAYLKDCRLTTKPGEKYVYSNLAVGLLGVILEKISGQSFEQMVGELICKPLGMKNTVQHLYPMLTPRFAPVYNDDGRQTAPWDFDVLAPCGSLRSTVNDLVLYARANLNDNGPGSLAKAFKLTHEVTFASDAKLGLAWHIILVDGVSYYFHDGGTYGSSSFLAFNKEKNLAVIVLSNASASTIAAGVDILRKLQ